MRPSFEHDLQVFLMKVKISIAEAARNLGDCLARIKHTGDDFVLSKSNRPVVELGPLLGARRTTLGKLWDAMRQTSVDDDFAENLEWVNRSDSPMENPSR